MPVYNGEKYLQESIESILNQTFTNFEFIIIDDGSTDNSLGIINQYAANDPRLIVISRENRNVARTLNEIILLSKGIWIARMDQDDISLPNRFDLQLSWLKNTNADICGSWIKLFGTSDKRTIRYPEADSSIKAEMLFRTPFAHPTTFMRRERLAELMYSEDGWQAEDYDLWVRAANAGWIMTNIQEPLLFYRQHKNQISSKYHEKQKKLSNTIKKRYWEQYNFQFNLSKDIIDVIVESRPLDIKDIPIIYNLFDVMMRDKKIENQDVFFKNITRYFFTIAPYVKNVTSQWIKLNYIYRNKKLISSLTIIVALKLISFFNIKSDGRVFNFFKKIYNNLIK